MHKVEGERAHDQQGKINRGKTKSVHHTASYSRDIEAHDAREPEHMYEFDRTRDLNVR